MKYLMLILGAVFAFFTLTSLVFAACFAFLPLCAALLFGCLCAAFWMGMESRIRCEQTSAAPHPGPLPIASPTAQGGEGEIVPASLGAPSTLNSPTLN